nr:UBP1-associated protein 2C-like [Tanacetum cinerariifolium]
MEDMINQSKKRNAETLNDTVSLTQQDARKILQPFPKAQLIDILQTLITHDVAALSAVRSIADTDPSHRKLFIGGIGWDTTTATLKSVFEVYGEVEEGLVIVDKATNKSKEYGFVTFKRVDGAVKALVPPSYSSSGYPAGTGYNSGGYASAVAAAAQEYPGQNSYRPLMNRLPPIQGGYADSRNYGPSSGNPTHLTCQRLVQEVLMVGCTRAGIRIIENMNLHKVDYVNV